MNLNDYVLLLLQAVIIAAVPIFAAAIKSGAGKLFDIMKDKTKSEKMQLYLSQIKDAIEMAVSCTSQTYVDSLKKGGEFNKEEQKAALLKSLEATRQSLSPWVKNFIITTYGDMDEYLTRMIEAEVRKQKISVGSEQLTV
jgi:hypothetical protein